MINYNRHLYLSYYEDEYELKKLKKTLLNNIHFQNDVFK
jgi:energy-converting hydrogenase A subunit M